MNELDRKRWQKRLDLDGNIVESLASTLSSFQNCKADYLPIDAWALGHVHRLMLMHTMQLRETIKELFDELEAASSEGAED